MKKILLSFFILISAFAYSQNANRNYVGISVGPSFPSGDFGRMDLNDSTSGYAKTGVAINVNYAYRITHNFGIQALINYSSNSVNTTNYSADLEAAHPDTMFSVENTRAWSGGGIMVGPYITLPLSDNFSWDIRAMIGATGGNSPGLIIRASTDTETLPEYTRLSGSSFSWGYSFGTGFKIKLAKYYVLLFTDYVSSQQTYENVTGLDWAKEPYTITVKQNITYLDVTIGLGYFF